jgi:hypothetical protein
VITRPPMYGRVVLLLLIVAGWITGLALGVPPVFTIIAAVAWWAGLKAGWLVGLMRLGNFEMRQRRQRARW